MAITQAFRQLGIGTPLGPDVLGLRSIAVQEHLSRPFQIDAQMSSEDGKIDFDKVIGENVTIRLELGSNQTRYFNGIVSRFTQVANLGPYAQYRATIVPWIWLLTRTADCRIFQNKTTPEIIEDVFKALDLNDYQLQLSASYAPWEYCVQYRETDFNFVSRLMEEEGIYYYFKHENGKHTLMLVDAISAHSAFPGYEEVAFSELEKGAPTREVIIDWTMSKEVQPGVCALKDFDFTKPKTPLASCASTSRTYAGAGFEVYDYPGDYLDTGEGDRLANVRLDEFQSQYEVLHGQATARGLATGCTFKLRNFPRTDQNREYLVTGVALNVDAGEFASSSGAKAGPAFFSCSFLAIDLAQQFRPPRRTPRPVVQGPQTAFVVGPKGEEIHTDKYGRVKVQFHWDRDGKGDENSSCWMRVASGMAGKQWGEIALPRVGQEVMVEFLEGDPDQPIITGRVYNAEAMPPYPLPDEKTKSTVKTNSTKGDNGFNEIRFEDKKGKEQIFIHGQHNMDVRVRNTLKETVYGNREIRVGWEKDGATGGELNALVKEDLNLHVKGAQYDQVEKDVNKSVEGNLIQQFKTDHNTKIVGQCNLNAKAISLEVQDKVNYKASATAIECGDGFGLKVGALKVETTDGVSLKCGGNFVVIDQSGVTIKGSLVKINSGGSAQSAASAESPQLPDLQTPIDAVVADDGKPGKHTAAGPYTPRQHGKIKLEVAKAKPFKPPPEPPAPPPEGTCAPVPVSDKPCGIKELKVRCEHKAKGKPRGPGEGCVLQVVPEANKSDSIGREFSGDSLGKFKFEISGTKKYGGQEKVTIEVVKVDESASGRKQSALTRVTGPPAESAWLDTTQPHTYPVEAPQSPPLWSAGIEPVSYWAYGRGCDEVLQQCLVEVYPSENYEVKLSLEIFGKLAGKLNKWLDKHCSKTWGDVKVGLEVEPPSGEFAISWGWNEDEDWRAYFAAGVKPECKLFGLKGYGKWNLRDTGIRYALTAIGIPPPVSEALLKLKNEYADYRADHDKEPSDLLDYLMQVIVELSLTGSPRLKGELKKKFYPHGTEVWDGEVKAVGQVELKLNVRGQIGSEQLWNYVKLEGEGTTGLDFELKFELEKDGLYGLPSISFPGIKVKVTAALMVVKIKKGKSAEWSPLEKRQVYPDPEDGDPPKWHLIQMGD